MQNNNRPYYIGCGISLISKSGIRYAGTLYSIDPTQSTVALQNVRSFGSEGRRKDGQQIPPQNHVYEYIIFRSSDIKHLEVCEPPRNPNQPPNDPAIINVQGQNLGFPKQGNPYVAMPPMYFYNNPYAAAMYNQYNPYANPYAPGAAQAQRPGLGPVQQLHPGMDPAMGMGQQMGVTAQGEEQQDGEGEGGEGERVEEEDDKKGENEKNKEEGKKQQGEEEEEEEQGKKEENEKNKEEVIEEEEKTEEEEKKLSEEEENKKEEGEIIEGSSNSSNNSGNNSKQGIVRKDYSNRSGRGGGSSYHRQQSQMNDRIVGRGSGGERRGRGRGGYMSGGGDRSNNIGGRGRGSVGRGGNGGNVGKEEKKKEGGVVGEFDFEKAASLFDLEQYKEEIQKVGVKEEEEEGEEVGEEKGEKGESGGKGGGAVVKAYDKSSSFFDNLVPDNSETKARTSYAEQRKVDVETFGQTSLYDNRHRGRKYPGQGQRDNRRGGYSNGNRGGYRGERSEHREYRNNDHRGSGSGGRGEGGYQRGGHTKKVFVPVNSQENGKTK